MKPEYMPTNPCEYCERQLVAQRESSFTLDGKCVCLILAEYTQKISAQIELWEWIRREHLIGNSVINQQLKLMEDNK